VRFAIRDDDACYFTRPERLERVYRGIWERIPICVATVPFAIGYERTGIPEEHWHSGESFPLDRNPEMVAFLKEQIAARRATIALHGYTHQDFADGYEFQAAPDPEHRLRHGLAYLRETLSAPISIFVPPHNALSKRGLAAVASAGLNLLGSFLSFRPSMRPWDLRTPANWWRIRQYRARTSRSRTDRMVFPFVLRYSRHAEFGCHSLIPGTTAEQLIAGFEEARRAGGDFCVATHYWEVSDAMRDVLCRVIDHAAACQGVRFAAAEELFA
jgi:predicted deacetylase